MVEKYFSGTTAKEWAAGEREIEFDAMVQQCSLDRFLDSFPYGKATFTHVHNNRTTNQQVEAPSSNPYASDVPKNIQGKSPSPRTKNALFMPSLYGVDGG